MDYVGFFTGLSYRAMLLVDVGSRKVSGRSARPKEAKQVKQQRD